MILMLRSDRRFRQSETRLCAEGKSAWINRRLGRVNLRLTWTWTEWRQGAVSALSTLWCSVMVVTSRWINKNCLFRAANRIILFRLAYGESSNRFVQCANKLKRPSSGMVLLDPRLFFQRKRVVNLMNVFRSVSSVPSHLVGHFSGRELMILVNFLVYG